VPRSHAPSADALEDLWQTYYASTFNPARVNVEQMRVHMPQRSWCLLPELQVLNDLVRTARCRESLMLDAQPAGSATAWIPPNSSLPMLREAVHSCRACELWEHATQPVFGEGPPDARIVCVGEQPGDNEDLKGRPFVGPAGQLFDRAVADAGLRRSDLYITGAVKHFRYQQRGKVRIHKTASKAQVAACQPWLEAELALIRPRVVVCLGNTAVLSVIGRGVRLMEQRGRVMPHRLAGGALVTVHPGFLLRMPDVVRREAEYARFVDDLRVAAAFADQRTPPFPNEFDRASFAKCS
jgi:DNA polymerase